MASSFDLSRLADVKNWLNIVGGDDDSLIVQLIAQTSRAILTYLDRPSILPFIYTETYDGGDDASIVLRQWPVNKVVSCSINGLSIPPSSVTAAGYASGYVVDAVDVAPPGRPQRLSLRGQLFPCGIQNIRVAYSSGYLVSGEQATVPAQSPYTIVSSAPYGGWASDEGVAYANGAALTAVTANPSAGQFTVANGIYNFSVADAGAQMTLNYGYVPADLAVCCMDWVAERYAYRTRIGQQSKSLGGQETMAFIVKDIPDYAIRILQPYRRVVAP